MRTWILVKDKVAYWKLYSTAAYCAVKWKIWITLNRLHKISRKRLDPVGGRMSPDKEDEERERDRWKKMYSTGYTYDTWYITRCPLIRQGCHMLCYGFRLRKTHSQVKNGATHLTTGVTSGKTKIISNTVHVCLEFTKRISALLLTVNWAVII